MEFLASPPAEYRGSTSDDVAVRYLGRASDGSAQLQLNLRTPDRLEYDLPATARQLAAVDAIFPHVPSTVSQSQAHAILCYRDYSKAVIDRVLPSLRLEDRDLWLVIIATLVSHDERIAKDVRRWSDDRFIQARSEPRIITTKHFKGLMMICRDLGKAMSL